MKKMFFLFGLVFLFGACDNGTNPELETSSSSNGFEPIESSSSEMVLSRSSSSSDVLDVSSSGNESSSSSILTNSSSSVTIGEYFTDERDGKVYRYVAIGSQIWMAENLNYETAEGSWCYNNEKAKCDKYGRLYHWAAVTALPDSCRNETCYTLLQRPHQGICPQGWYIPSKYDWSTLASYEESGKKLKARTDWFDDGAGTDDYGFSALPGGAYYPNGVFSNINKYGFWWTVSENGPSVAHYRVMMAHSDDADASARYKDHGFSVRCIKGTILCGMTEIDTATHFCEYETVYAKCNGKTYNPITYGCNNNVIQNKCGDVFYDSFEQICTEGILKDKEVFTDSRDGKTYKIATIGTQTWMAENLNYETEDGSWCYDNETENCDIYGRLYNWATAMNFADSCNSEVCDSLIQAKHEGICPTGWHVPTKEEWQSLLLFINHPYTSSYNAKKLKAVSGWNDYNGDDDYGFSALPGGGRNSSGIFSDIGNKGYWWTTTEFGNNYAYFRSMFSDSDRVGENYDYKSGSAMVRCIKDE